MTVDDEDTSAKKSRTKRARRYIPHLAEFYFKPTYDWSEEEANSLFDERISLSSDLQLDTVLYEDCVVGMTKLPKSSVNLVVADPPFGIGFDGKSSVYNRDETLVIDGYEEVQGSYEKFTISWISELPRILREDGSAYIFSGWTNLESILKGAREAGLETINHIIWHYPFGVFTKRRFVTSHYHVILLAKDRKEFFFNKLEHYPEDVWTVSRQYRAGESKNSTKLPFEVVSRCIDYSSRPGDVVLDPFMGNGTTAAVAKANWRHYVGFEINKKLSRIINSEVKSTTLGSQYTPYTQRLPTIEELAKEYPRAYKEYLKVEQKE